MAAPVLRHYRVQSSATPSTWLAVHAAVPAARALAVSKLIVTNLTASPQNISVGVGSTLGTGGNTVSMLTLNPGETYSESGIVVLATEYVQILSTVASGCAIQVNGEEVDN